MEHVHLRWPQPALNGPLKQKSEQLFATYSSFTDTGPAEGFSDGTDFSLLFV